ncbi:hypothetical protein B0H14DRAFT_3492367 [Mycena olivaceomarginata]|nr:hypothetical protein B0H14DRAFT_3492367 [Mycena olivaceomarginata]
MIVDLKTWPLSISQMKTTQKNNKTHINGIDKSDPDSYRRYKKWRASREYNERYGNRNRETRNAKKRERMAALCAKQKLDPPTVQAARLAAKEESARKYREKNRNILALKAAVARSNVSWERQCALEDARWLAMRQGNRLDHALLDIEPDASDQE